MTLYQALLRLVGKADPRVPDLYRTREEQQALEKSLVERSSIKNLPTFVSYLLLSGDPKLAAACSGNDELVNRLVKLEESYK